MQLSVSVRRLTEGFTEKLTVIVGFDYSLHGRYEQSGLTITSRWENYHFDDAAVSDTQTETDACMQQQ
jgi:hypothetical protein